MNPKHILPLILLFAGLTAGCDTGTTAGTPGGVSPPAEVRIDTAADIPGWHVTVEKIRQAKEFDWSGNKDIQTAKGQYEFVYLTAENKTDKTATVNSADYKLSDSTGAEYAACTDPGCFAYAKLIKRNTFNVETPAQAPSKILAIYDVGADAKDFTLSIQGKTKIALTKK